MANTGLKWGAYGADIIDNQALAASGGNYNSAAQSADGKALVKLHITAVFSNHAIVAGTGLLAYILKGDGTNYQVKASALPLGFLPGTQATTYYWVLEFEADDDWKLYLENTNTQASNTVTVDAKFKTADIPVAS